MKPSPPLLLNLGILLLICLLAGVLLFLVAGSPGAGAFLAGGILALSLLAAVLFYRCLARPLALLGDALKRAAGGDFSSRIYLKKNDLFSELAESYNRIAGWVSRRMDDLRSQKEELNCIVSSMQPGLLVLNAGGRVRLYNRSAERILGLHNLENRRSWEVLRQPRLWDTVQAVQRGGGSAREEAEIDGSFYQVTVAHLPATNETVMLFHDITHITSLQRIKADFVTNVSHELRTPLTAIKGYAETIKGVDPENARYVDIIKRHTDRLISIVEDLLSLSEMEETRGITREPVDLEEVVGHVLQMFEAGIRRKGLEVSTRVQPGLPPVPGDPLRLEQVMINLVDNAVKYTDQGGISFELREEREWVAVTVSDTGTGIPERHLPRVFERFYTADKSRSHRLGGTGLGLSIVKHIVQLHGGSIQVRSTPGRGTDFTVKLPL
ncbi:MAG: ATP-binding protein [Spirochaetota bacterium]